MGSATLPESWPLPETSTLKDYLTLLKPGVMSLVVFSGAAGMLVTPHGIHPFLALVVILSIAMGSGAGAAINMWYDRDIDQTMKRTQRRPLPAGRIEPSEALALGLALSVFSVMFLGLAANWLAAFILAFSIFFYGVIYTMLLKRTTPQNIVIGGAAGAFPPVIGWAAVTGEVGLYPFLLFAIIFLWTPPHFWALALYRNEDYQRANVPMMPVVQGAHFTSWQMLIYTLLLLAFTLLPWALGYAGALYGIAALLFGGKFLWHAAQVVSAPEEKAAKPMFRFSILYLFALFTALILDHWLL